MQVAISTDKITPHCIKSIEFITLQATGVVQAGKSTSFDPLSPRRFERKNEWGMGVGIAGISILTVTVKRKGMIL